MGSLPDAGPGFGEPVRGGLFRAAFRIDATMEHEFTIPSTHPVDGVGAVNNHGDFRREEKHLGSSRTGPCLVFIQRDDGASPVHLVAAQPERLDWTASRV